MAMRILYFSKASEIGPSSRYRIYQYLPLLADAGGFVSIKPLFGPWYYRLLSRRPLWLRTLLKSLYVPIRFLRRLWDLRTVREADLIVTEGQLFPYLGLGIERFLAKRRPFVVELDDAIYLTKGQETKIPVLLRLSTGVIVGNQVLAQYARTYNPNVSVVPTVVDTNRFKPGNMWQSQGPTSDRPITIVWMGLDYNLPYVRALSSVFRRLQASHRVRVRVICATAPSFEGVEVEFRRWRYDQEVEELQEADIGIMPLPDTEWAKGKCGLKLLQYMAVGLPAVASPVGVNQEIVRDGENGFLAAADEEWYAKLSTLCQDTDLRSRIGRRARQTVLDHYSLAVWAPKLAACYRDIAANQPPLAQNAAIAGVIRP